MLETQIDSAIRREYMSGSIKDRHDIRLLLSMQRLWGRIVDWSMRSGWRVDRGFCRFISFLALPKYLLDIPWPDSLKVWRLSWLGGGSLQVRVESQAPAVEVRSGTSDPYVFATIFLKNCYASSRQCENPEWILDAGAYTGYSAIYFASLFPKAKILCLEPEPSNFAILQKNTKVYPNIIALNQALWHRDEFLNLSSDDEIERLEHWGVQVHSSAPKTSNKEIAGRSLESLSQEYGVERWDILKIDIEGAEAKLFDEAMRKHIQAAQRVYIELHEHLVKGSSQGFFTLVETLDCQLAVEDENIVISPARLAG